MNLSHSSKNNSLIKKMAKSIARLTLRRSDLEELERSCESRDEFGKLVEGCFARVQIKGHNLISIIHSIIPPVKMQLVQFGMRLYLPLIGFVGVDEILEDFPKFDDPQFLYAIDEFNKEYSYFSISEEWADGKIKSIENVLGKNWQNDTVNTNRALKRKLDEIAGTVVSGPGELFRIFVYPEELVKLLELGREQFERAAVGLFVQIKMDKYFYVPSPAFYGTRRFVAQIAGVNWSKQQNGNDALGLGDVELHFEKIGTFPIQFIKESVTPSFVRNCLQKMIELGIPLPSKEFIMEKQKQFGTIFEKVSRDENVNENSNIVNFSEQSHQNPPSISAPPAFSNSSQAAEINSMPSPIILSTEELAQISTEMSNHQFPAIFDHPNDPIQQINLAAETFTAAVDDFATNMNNLFDNGPRVDEIFETRRILVNGDCGKEQSEAKLSNENEQERQMKKAFMNLHKSFSSTTLFPFAESSPFLQKIQQNFEERNKAKEKPIQNVASGSNSNGNTFENSSRKRIVGEGRKLISYENEFCIDDGQMNGEGNSALIINGIGVLAQNELPKRRKVISFDADDLDSEKRRTVNLAAAPKNGQPTQKGSIFERIRMDPDGQKKLADSILKNREIKQKIRISIPGKQPIPIDQPLPKMPHINQLPPPTPPPLPKMPPINQLPPPFSIPIDQPLPKMPTFNELPPLPLPLPKMPALNQLPPPPWQKIRVTFPGQKPIPIDQPLPKMKSIKQLPPPSIVICPSCKAALPTTNSNGELAQNGATILCGNCNHSFQFNYQN